ncbi:FliM/FliN family flagellar motor switch protein [Paracoccus seriniphilus]|uniref:Flagellar motor switch protein FliM n=1 Tax=Paracoccus seriniphilus TaxID=184748 RepID=A0A239PVR1_9RHOB|nr:FliM/FliN family flagellar motor C-terminal domain-containing protein [Paracoccus seriniphilus]WCR13372.1 FliM/FliN family flagellar motor switch protein [Paracoccus seriniphilus]SNT74384.1 flagellar motor switch protein FliM [Paracoccus seriniphilus]
MSGEAGKSAAGITSSRGGILRHMLAARNRATIDEGRVPQLPVPAPATPARGAATAVGRAADRLYRLALQPLSVVPGAVTLAELPEVVPLPSLLMVLQGKNDLIGMIALCPETVTALIEIQTLGRITGRSIEPRRPTRSDALICSDFVNALLEELARELIQVEGFADVSGYRYASFLDDLRPLTLMLEDRPYRSLMFELQFGSSAIRQGKIFLAVPQSDKHALPPENSARAEAQAARDPLPAADSVPPPVGLASAVGEAPVEIHGVLCRRHMTLAELRGLTAGKLLPLPRVSLSEARLETASGQLLGSGKFGEAEGCHAIRLHGRAGTHRTEAFPVQDSLGDDMAGDVTPAGSTVEPPIEDIGQPDPFREKAIGEGQDLADSDLESNKSHTKIGSNG